MRKGLGRGLDALLSPSNAPDNTRDSVFEVKINDVEPEYRTAQKGV